jgi:DNA-directed RNA polymerase subunit H (RpoH/RPB5)
MHLLQPKHSKVSVAEAKEMLQKYNISTFQLPRIKITDKALPPGIKLRDIIKIERKTANGEKAFYYRIVVE